MLPEINLLPKIEKQSSVLYVLFIVGTIVSVVLIGAMTYFYFVISGNLEDVEGELSQLNDEKLILEARLNNLGTNSDMANMEAAVTYVEQHMIPTSQFIDELRGTLPMTGSLGSYSYNYQTVQLNTEMGSMRDASRYMTDMQESELVNQITINQLNAVEDESGLSTYSANYIIDLDQRALLQEDEENE